MHSFDHFHIIRQGLLLSIDTFGVSHILPILSLPFIAMVWYNTTSKDDRLKDVILNNVTQVLYIWLLVQSRKTVYVLKEVWGTNSRNEGVRNPLCECAYWCEIWITEQLNKEKLHWRSPIFTVYSKSIFMHPCNFPYGSIPAVWCFDHITPNRLTYFFLSNLGVFDVWSCYSNHCYNDNHMRYYSKAALNGNYCSPLLNKSP